MNTHLSQTLDISTAKLKYDASVKELFADKQILARILKYSLEEFADSDIDDIIKEMDEPQVSKVSMEPGTPIFQRLRHQLKKIQFPEKARYFSIFASLFFMEMNR